VVVFHSEIGFKIEQDDEEEEEGEEEDETVEHCLKS
jgi:hypothetical protein